MSFLTDDILKGTDWRALERTVARIMAHAGWEDVNIIGGAGDLGGDILGVFPKTNRLESWVVQVKAVTGGKYVGVPAINEAVKAMSIYGTSVGATATNGSFTLSAEKRRRQLLDAGFDIKLWNGAFLRAFVEGMQENHARKRGLRSYQQEITSKTLAVYEAGGTKALYIVATGLGKTVIAATIAAELWHRGSRRILVLCHAQELALQLEMGFWPQLSKHIPTRYFFDGMPPLIYDGVNFGLYQSLYGYLGGIEPGSFDVVIVDEAHHALAHGFRKCIEHLKPRFLIGMTATPWRGDGKTITELFGEALARVSLVDGMAMGYLAQVDYRLYCDNINWEAVPELSKQRLTIRDLNKKLFLPQRDDAVISEIIRRANELKSPRIAIFSPSIDHGQRFAAMLSAAGIPCSPLSGVDKANRRRCLIDFATGKYHAVTAVDVMNEGIDVPDVNMLVFMRATHSRRIFVQQLGRGLRLAPDKEKVVVLDFVSDIRRLADVFVFDREGRKKNMESLFLKDNIVTFNDVKAERFIEAWLADVADLGEADDSEKLSFPEEY